MKYYNIEIGKDLILTSMVYRVEAKNKIEAIEKVKKLGFNSGFRLSSSYSGEFNPVVFDEVEANCNDMDNGLKPIKI